MTQAASVKHFLAIIATIVSIHSVSETYGHGILANPLPRGAVSGARLAPHMPAIDKSAPKDTLLHFPAGDRGNYNAGMKSQIKEGGRWTPFEPLKPGFKWRSGVYGDLKSPVEAHRSGGRFFHGGKIARTYIEGDVIDTHSSIVGHHNGFFEFHICNVNNCGGDISEHCFRNGACKQLQRAWTKQCESGYSKECGPIDRKNPGRWYLPCAMKSKSGGFDIYGLKGMMQYRLPRGMVCSHCVVHWMYSSANMCNPPGLVDYFKSTDRPKGWGECTGQAAARGGYASWLPKCGGLNFAQEFLNCADVRIVRRGAPKANPFSGIEIGEIRDRRFIRHGDFSNPKEFRVNAFRQWTVRASLKWPVPKLTFYIKDGNVSRAVSSMSMAPFYMFGSDSFGRPYTWKNPPTNRWIEVFAIADGFKVGGHIRLNE